MVAPMRRADVRPEYAGSDRVTTEHFVTKSGIRSPVGLPRPQFRQGFALARVELSPAEPRLQNDRSIQQFLHHVEGDLAHAEPPVSFLGGPVVALDIKPHSDDVA